MLRRKSCGADFCYGFGSKRRIDIIFGSHGAIEIFNYPGPIAVDFIPVGKRQVIYTAINTPGHFLLCIVRKFNAFGRRADENPLRHALRGRLAHSEIDELLRSFPARRIGNQLQPDIATNRALLRHDEIDQQSRSRIANAELA